MRKNTRLVVVVVFALTLIHRAPAQGASTPEDSSVVVIDATAPTHPLPHFWEQMFGSERAIVTLRESYRKDLRDVKKITGFEYVRFHAIFHDEVGVYDEDPQGRPQYNFSYVDQIYDGLLANGVRPLVELSFMPKKLAAREGDLHPFWYKQNVSPPKDWDKWDDLITAFTKHLVERYGIDDRLSVVIEMVIGTDGSLQDSDIYRARVRNHAKLAYNSVANNGKRVRSAK